MNFRSGDNSKISPFFQQAQHVSDPNEEEHLVEELKHVYDKVSFKDFVERFLECLKLCLIHSEEAPSVGAVLDFAAHFVAAINCSGPDEEETCPFLKKILEFVCANHGCDNAFVRSRLCLFVDKLLCKLGNEVVIDEMLYNKLVDSMLERMKDKMPGIRVRAISAVYRLQDPFDANCPVVKALSFHLSMDPSVEARRTILRKLAVAAHTLPTIVERIYDVKDFVRKDAFLVLSKCSMSRFTIKQRQMLLYSGLKDRDERVSKCVEKVLLPLWFDHAKNDFVNMLGFLDVETSTETSYLVLQILFKGSSPQTITEQLKSQLDEDNLIPHDKLLPENAFFWRCTVHYLHNLDNEELDEDNELLVQSLLPELTPLTNYIRDYFLKDSEEDGKLEIWEQKQRQFILLQLLQLSNVHDLSDELGRSQLKQLCTDLLLSPHVKKDAVSVIVNVFSRILPNIDEFLNTLVEIIMDLKEPFKDDENMDLSEEEADEEKKENEIVKIPPEVLAKCLTIVVEFLQNKNVTTFNPCLRSLVTTFVCPALEAQDTTSRVLALHSLSNSCLLDVDLAKQYFLLFCFQVANDDMCLVALKGIFDLLLFYGLGIFNLSDQIDDNEEKKDDEPEKKKRRLKGAMVEENSFVSNSGEANTSTNEALSDLTDQSANLITMLTSLLDSSSSDIRNVTVEGLCKLIIGGRITSVNLLSKLIIMWFSPISEEDYILRQQLGTFFNVYASSFAGSHFMFQQAFLPTLKTLYDAPLDSPLHEIDPDDVAKLLISLMFVRMNKEKGPNPHNSLALSICKEILSTYSANLGNVPVLVRSLLPLQLSYEEPEFLKELKELCEQVLELLEEANNRILAKYMQKIIFKIEGAEADIGIQPSDVNNTEQSSEPTDRNMSAVDDSIEDSEAVNESSARGPETRDDKTKNSKKKADSGKSPAKTPLRVSDEEENDSKDIDNIEPDVFNGDDSDVDESSASPTTKNEEYSLSRINLKKKKDVEEGKLEKTEEANSAVKKITGSEDDKLDEERKSIQTRKSTRKKGDDIAPTPSKKSRQQVSKSKNSIQGKENEKVGSDDEGDEDSDDATADSSLDRKKRYTKKSKIMESPKQSPDKKEGEVRGRTRRMGQKPSLEETPKKKVKQTPSKSLSLEKSTRKQGVGGKDLSESSDESDSEDNSKKVSGGKSGKQDNTNQEKSMSLRRNALTNPTPSKTIKLIQVENIGKHKEPSKRKSNDPTVESSPKVKRQPIKSSEELSSVTSERGTRSSRAISGIPSTPLKKTDEQLSKNVTDVSPYKSPRHKELADVGNKISKSPESPKQLEYKRSVKDFKILEEISRRLSRHKPDDVVKTINRSNKSSKQSPSKKKLSGSESDDSTNERDSEAKKSHSPAKLSHSKRSDRSSKSSKLKTDSAVKKIVSEAPKSPSTKAKSDKKNVRKSLRVALHRLDIPEQRKSKAAFGNSSRRRSRSASITPVKKSVEIRSRSSVDVSKRGLRNADSLLRKVLTPKKAPPSPKNPESPPKSAPPSKSESRTSRSLFKTASVEEVSQSVSNHHSPIKFDSKSPSRSRISEYNKDSSVTSPRKSRSTDKTSDNEETPVKKTSEKKTQSRVQSLSPDKESEPRQSRSGKVPSPIRSPSAAKNVNSRASMSTSKELSSSLKRSSPIKENESRNTRSIEKRTSALEKSPSSAKKQVSRESQLAKGKDLSPKKSISLEVEDDLNKRLSRVKKSLTFGKPLEEIKTSEKISPSRVETSSSVKNLETNRSRRSQSFSDKINLRQSQRAKKNVVSPKKTPSPARNINTRPSRSVKKKILSPKKSPSSPKKVSPRQSESAKKRLETPKKSLSPSKKVESRKSSLVRKETQSPKKSLSSSKKSSASRSISKKSVSPKRSVSPKKSISPAKKMNSRQSRSVKKKLSMTPKKSLSPRKTTNSRQSQSVKKTSVSPKKSLSPVKNKISIPKKMYSPVKKGGPSGQQSSTKQNPKRSLLPVRKVDSRQSQNQTKVSTKSTSLGKKVVSRPRLSIGKKTLTLGKRQLLVRKSDLKQSVVSKKKVDLKRSIAVKRKQSIPKLSVSPKNKIATVARGRSAEVRAVPTKRSKSVVNNSEAKKGAQPSPITGKGSRSRSVATSSVRKTPSKLTR